MPSMYLAIRVFSWLLLFRSYYSSGALSSAPPPSSLQQDTTKDRNRKVPTPPAAKAYHRKMVGIKPLQEHRTDRDKMRRKQTPRGNSDPRVKHYGYHRKMVGIGGIKPLQEHRADPSQNEAEADPAR
eukprot:3665116-Rhodomonas_salina.1